MIIKIIRLFMMITISLGSGLTATRSVAAELAEQYPSKPIRMIVPFPPGGGTDTITRIIGQKLGEVWKQSVIVENRPGAGGIVASSAVANAPKDGYTLGIFTPTQTIIPSLYKTLPFDVERDFAPVVQMNELQLILVASPSFKPDTVAELIDYAKTHPGTVNFGSTGTGGAAHLAMELLMKMSGVKMTHIPYKGSAPAYTDLMGGRIQLLSNNIISTMPLIQRNDLKAIAVLGNTRSSIAPDVSTIAESGLPGYDVKSWFGIVAPANTPKDIIEKINATVVSIINEPNIKKQMLLQGAEPVQGQNTPEDFGRLMQEEKKKWATLIDSVGISIETTAK